MDTFLGLVILVFGNSILPKGLVSFLFFLEDFKGYFIYQQGRLIVGIKVVLQVGKLSQIVPYA